MLLSPLHDFRLSDPSVVYKVARRSFIHGDLDSSEDQAMRGYWVYRKTSPIWSVRFQLLTAEVLATKGLSDQALRLLENLPSQNMGPDETVRALTIESNALTRQQQLTLSRQKLDQAEELCKNAEFPSCGDAMQARGVYEGAMGRYLEARKYFLDGLHFAREHHNPFLEAISGLDVGWAAMQVDRFDEAIDWFMTANVTAKAIGAKDLSEALLGNLGWAYFNLGDSERALALYGDAEKTAAALGNMRKQLGWLSAEGNVYQSRNELERSLQAYDDSLIIARKLNSRDDIMNCLEDLAHISVDIGHVNEAEKYIQELGPLLRDGGSPVDALYVDLARGKIAAARHQDEQAKAIFQSVQLAMGSQLSMRLDAGHELAKLYEREGETSQAQKKYVETLATFEAARKQLKNEDSKLPFVTIAFGIYDDYIHFLVKQGKTVEALAVADQSRARTLEQGLGIHISTDGVSSKDSHYLDASLIARRAKATLLFYWLGEKQSYLWVATPQKTTFFTLPPRVQIDHLVERYRRELLGPEDTFASTTKDGEDLYRMLIEPAASLIPHDSKVVILGDGALNLLNFETLVVPGSPSHFYIEDATLTSAPSLKLLLVSTERPDTAGGKLLLMGDAISHNPNYPQLPMAMREMNEVESHFASGSRKVLAEQGATPHAYLASHPAQFGYIHFVAHGMASSTDPLESAIILSPEGGYENGDFKLYARDIMQHPIRARLVTVSACYGSGDRSYAGEGLVGLSWAFLRAGAHNVIGALWEVSDASTPQLMNSLYAGVAAGQSPAQALRQAKLKLLHSKGNFKRPFYWAPFQLYTGL